MDPDNPPNIAVKRQPRRFTNMLVKGPRTNIKAIPIEPTHAGLKIKANKRLLLDFFQNNIKTGSVCNDVFRLKKLILILQDINQVVTCSKGLNN